jgi:tetratricopeptide (TPR) repeat protein
MDPEPRKEDREREPSATRPRNATRSYLTYLGSLRKQARTGLLTITSGSTTRTFCVESGIVTMVWASDHVTFYREVLASMDGFKEKKLVKALRDPRAANAFLMETAVEAGIVTRDAARSRLDALAREELFVNSLRRGTSVQFSAGAVDMATLGRGVQTWKLHVDLLEGVVALCREKGYSEQMLADLLPAEDLVLGTTTSPAQGKPASGVAAELLQLVDGARSVAEIIKGSSHPRFESWIALLSLEMAGLVQPLVSADLVVAGHRFRKEGRTDRALQLFLRAEEMGGGSPDLDLTIGRAYELMGESAQAVDRYLRHASAELVDRDPDAALEVLRRVVSLDRDCVDARQRMCAILDRKGAVDDLVIELRALAQVQQRVGERRDAILALERIVALGRADQGLLDELTQLASEDGSPQGAAGFLRRLAAEHASHLEPVAARLLHEHLSRIAPEALDVRLELGRALEREGRGEAALRIYRELLLKVLEPGGFPEALAPRLRFAAERILARDADNVEALLGLSRLATASGDAPAGRSCLEKLAAIHEREGRPREAAEALEELSQGGVQDAAMQRRLALALHQAGEDERAVSVLLSVGRSALEEKDLDEAESCLRRCLDLSPFRVEVHQGLLEIHRQRGDAREGRECLVNLISLHRISGDMEARESALRELIPIAESETSWRLVLSEILEATRREEEAIETLLEIARMEERAGNRGHASRACERVLRLVPGHVQASRLLESIHRTPVAPLVGGRSDEPQLGSRLESLEQSLGRRIEDLASRLKETGREDRPPTPAIRERIEPVVDSSPVVAMPSPRKPVSAVPAGAPVSVLPVSLPIQEPQEGAKEVTEGDRAAASDIASIVARLKDLRS